MTSAELRALADEHERTEFWIDTAYEVPLIALAPHLARLCADMADELRKHSWAIEGDYVNKPQADVLLKRLWELVA